MDKTYRYSSRHRRRGWLIVLFGAAFIALGAYVSLKRGMDVSDWLSFLGIVALGAFILVWGLDTVMHRIALDDAQLWMLGPAVRRAVPYTRIEGMEEKHDAPPQRLLTKGWTLELRLKSQEQALAIYDVDDLVRYDDLVSELEARTGLRVKRRREAGLSMGR